MGTWTSKLINPEEVLSVDRLDFSLFFFFFSHLLEPEFLGVNVGNDRKVNFSLNDYCLLLLKLLRIIIYSSIISIRFSCKSPFICELLLCPEKRRIIEVTIMFKFFIHGG